MKSVLLASVKELLDCGINLYIQKEQFNLLGEDGKPSLLAPIMLATLSTCAQLERENITFRLQSGRKQYVAKGGRLGRKPGSVKTVEQKREEYKDVIALLRKGYVIRERVLLSTLPFGLNEMLNPSQKHIKFMAFPLHVTTHAIHVNRSSPLPFSAYLCRAFPKGGATVRLQNGGS